MQGLAVKDFIGASRAGLQDLSDGEIHIEFISSDERHSLLETGDYSFGKKRYTLQVTVPYAMGKPSLGEIAIESVEY